MSLKTIQAKQMYVKKEWKYPFIPLTKGSYHWCVCPKYFIILAYNYVEIGRVISYLLKLSVNSIWQTDTTSQTDAI